MSTEKDQLFKIIRKQLPKNVLFTEEIADVLDVSYDASYRRIKGKTSLTFEEALKLAKHYKISLNELFDLPNNNSILINKNKFNNNIEDLLQFYRELTRYTKSFSIRQETDVIYSAKDIPFYHVKTDSLYWKFRVYVHLHFSQKKQQLKSKPSFFDFKPKFSTIEEANNFRDSFKQTHITDIWADTTINSSLHQIFYFFRTKVLKKEDASHLCDELTKMLKEIELNASKNRLTAKNKKKFKFELYYSKLLNLNHTIFIKNQTKKGLLLPYNSYSHIKIEDKYVCNDVDAYIQKQLQLAKKISGDSEVERKVFFTTMYEKINQLKHEINSKILISFS